MKTINLRDYYPFYTSDCFIDVPDEVFEQIQAYERSETAYQRRMYYHRAHYSLDCNDGIENAAIVKPPTPNEIFEQKWTLAQLRAAIASLPDKQRRRVCAYFFDGMKKSEIARAEGIGETAVADSIKRSLRNMEKFLRKSF